MLIWTLTCVGVAAFVLAAFAVCDLRKQNKRYENEPVFYCSKCEQINTTEKCVHCGKDGARMPRGKAYKMLDSVNTNRFIEWRNAGRVIPEVE